MNETVYPLTLYYESACPLCKAEMQNLMLRNTERPMTACHGDFRADNMFYGLGDGSDIAIIDWQIVGRGVGPFDPASGFNEGGEQGLVSPDADHRSAVPELSVEGGVLGGRPDRRVGRCAEPFEVESGSQATFGAV